LFFAVLWLAFPLNLIRIASPILESTSLTPIHLPCVGLSSRQKMLDRVLCAAKTEQWRLFCFLRGVSCPVEPSIGGVEWLSWQIGE